MQIVIDQERIMTVLYRISPKLATFVQRFFLPFLTTFSTILELNIAILAIIWLKYLPFLATIWYRGQTVQMLLLNIWTRVVIIWMLKVAKNGKNVELQLPIWQLNIAHLSLCLVDFPSFCSASFQCALRTMCSPHTGLQCCDHNRIWGDRLHLQHVTIHLLLQWESCGVLVLLPEPQQHHWWEGGYKYCSTVGRYGKWLHHC